MNSIITENNIPCCWFQDAGVEKRRRAPHASQDMVSISTLIQPLLAQFTAPTTCKCKYQKSNDMPWNLRETGWGKVAKGGWHLAVDKSLLIRQLNHYWQREVMNHEAKSFRQRRWHVPCQILSTKDKLLYFNKTCVILK